MLIISRICVGLAVLVMTIHGSNEPIKQILNDMIEHGGNIDKLFKPLKYINNGGVGVVFKGIRIADNKLVALKFMDGNRMEDPHREYKIYTYLHAIATPNVERFGIPTVYYYKKWKGFILMVLSYLNGGDLITAVEAGHFKNPLDSLILFRDFIIQSKYLHSHGVRHDDIKPENILIDLNSGRSFLFDFDVSCKMNEFGNGTTLEYASRQYHNNQIRNAISDWESFLYTICTINYVKLDWLFGNELSQYPLRVASEKCANWKKNIKKTIEKIDKYIKSSPLKEVFLAFANQVFYNGDNAFPDYDGIYYLICDKIRAMGKCPETARFTWTSVSDGKRLPDIEEDIHSPKLIDFNHFTYPKVDLNHFVAKKK